MLISVFVVRARLLRPSMRAAQEAATEGKANSFPSKMKERPRYATHAPLGHRHIKHRQCLTDLLHPLIQSFCRLSDNTPDRAIGITASAIDRASKLRAPGDQGRIFATNLLSELGQAPRCRIGRPFA